MRKGSIQPILLLLITFVSITAFLIGKNIENRQEIRKQAIECLCIDDSDCGIYGNMYCYGAPCGECRIRSNPSPSPTSTPSPTTYTCSLNNGTCIYPGEPCVTRLLSFSCENNYDCCQNYVAPTPSPTLGCTNIKDATECAYDPACLWSNNQCINNNNCLNGSCYQTCTPGQKQCETDANGINWSKTCASNGISWESVSCGYGCSSGICNSAPSPSPISFPILVPSPSPDITIPKSNNYICSKDTDCASNHCYPTAVQGGTIGLCGTTDQPPQITQLIKLGGTCGTNAYDRVCETPNVCYDNVCRDANLVLDTNVFDNSISNTPDYAVDFDQQGLDTCVKDLQSQACNDYIDNKVASSLINNSTPTVSTLPLNYTYDKYKRQIFGDTLDKDLFFPENPNVMFVGTSLFSHNTATELTAELFAANGISANYLGDMLSKNKLISQEGHSGYKVNDILQKLIKEDPWKVTDGKVIISNNFRKNIAKSNLVYINLGTNDAAFIKNPEIFHDYYAALIDEIRQINPYVIIVGDKIPPSIDPEIDINIAKNNLQLDIIASEKHILITEDLRNKWVKYDENGLVDQQYLQQFLLDDVHPNLLGSQDMAENLFDTVYPRITEDQIPPLITPYSSNYPILQ